MLILIEEREVKDIRETGEYLLIVAVSEYWREAVHSLTGVSVKMLEGNSKFSQKIENGKAVVLQTPERKGAKTYGFRAVVDGLSCERVELPKRGIAVPRYVIHFAVMEEISILSLNEKIALERKNKQRKK